jgi:hypothetical protein
VGIGSVLTLSVLTFVGPAEAQLSSGDFIAFPGTARYQALLDGTVTNARVYGAVGSLERNILPNLVHDGQLVARFEVNQLWAATRLPGYCIGNSGFYNCKNQVILGDVDLFSSSLGIGYKVGAVSFFYSAGVTGSATFDTSAERYLAYNGIAPTYGLVYSLLAPALGTSNDPSIGSVQRDWIGGVEADAQVAKIRVGYLGSKGLFTNVTQDKLRLFLSSLLTEELKELTYLKAGLDRLALLKELGETSLYLRKLAIPSPQTAATGVSDDFRAKERDAIDFLTTHFQQYSIAEHIDASVAAAFRPSAFLHELSVGYHNANFFVPAGATQEDSQRIGEGYRFSMGYVRLPSLPAMGADGGGKLTLSVELKTTWGGNVEGIPMKIIIRRNDPEILSTFPFARDAWNIYWALGVGGI